MSEPLLALAQSWLGWVFPASIQAAFLGVLVHGVDLAIGRRAWHEVRAAAWIAILLRLLVPPGIATWDVSRAGVQIFAGASASGEIAGALFVIWTLGVVVFSASALVQSRRLHRWCRVDSRGVRDEEILALLAAVGRRLGLRSPPGLRVTSDSSIPAAVGLLRHTVVIPESLLRADRRRDLEHVLLHECAHVRRWDSMRALGALVVQILFWFHPIVWLAASRLASLREIGCDQAVARLLGDGARGYCRTLASLARPDLVQAPAGALGFFRKRSDLVIRMERLVRPGSRHRAGRCAAAALLLLLVLACGPGLESPIARQSQAPDVLASRGCWQLRFEVMRALADAERANAR